MPRLRSVPGIGLVTAAIDDAGRFPDAHQLEAHLGPVPREFSSGDSQRRGPIIRDGTVYTPRGPAACPTAAGAALHA